MSTMHLGTLSPTEDDHTVIDLKQAAFQVTPVDTVTPSLTPTSPPEGEAMTGKKLYSLERPDDRAKELASKLTLEEQVCCSHNDNTTCAFPFLYGQSISFEIQTFHRFQSHIHD